MDLLNRSRGNTHGSGPVSRFVLLGALVALFALLPAAGALADTTIEAESMALQDSGVHVFNDATASGGQALAFDSPDTATKTVTTGSASTLTLTARGDQCQGAPEAVVMIDGVTLFTVLVPATAWTQYSTAVNIAAGTHTVVIAYDNDLYLKGVCDRNLRVDKLTLSGSSASQPPSTPSGLVATPGNGQVALAWNANTDSGLAGYDVYRSSTSGGPYTNLTSTPVTTPSYNDTGVVNGTTYYYVVKAINTANQLSGASTQVSATPAASTGETTTKIEAESMTLPDSDVHVFSDATASGGKALNFTSNDTATKTVAMGAISKIVLSARGDQCQGAPEAVIKVDGAKVFSTLVPATTWTQYSANVNIAAGTHTIVLEYDNDLYVPNTCDRNLRADYIALSSTGVAPTRLLPDMVQRPPSHLGIVQVGAEFRLGFQSSVENIGAGQLQIHGHRANTESTMIADQVIHMSDGSTETRAGIGTMIFYVPHNHWHYLGFDHYELRKASDYSLIAPDQKMGFCLGDRFGIHEGVITDPPVPPGPFTENNCESGNPSALAITEGITPGYGDLYSPQVEGQYLNITGVPAGEYEIVHRVNEDHSLLESNYNNDTASVLIKLTLSGPPGEQVPAMELLKTCPESEHCTAGTSSSVVKALAPSSASSALTPSVSEPTGPVPLQLVDPPLLLPRVARYFATQALRRTFNSPLRELGVGCRRITNIRYACMVTLRVRSARYTGRVTVAESGSGLPAWSYSLRLVRHGSRGSQHGVSAHASSIVRASARVVVRSTLPSQRGAQVSGPLFWCVPPVPAKSARKR
jgi:hypothetical protein